MLIDDKSLYTNRNDAKSCKKLGNKNREKREGKKGKKQRQHSNFGTAVRVEIREMGEEKKLMAPLALEYWLKCELFCSERLRKNNNNFNFKKKKKLQKRRRATR